MLELDVVTQLGDLRIAARLSVALGECVALTGPSGAGKTTTLRMIAGLHRPASGSVRCGAETWHDDERGIVVAPARRRVGYLFQEYALFPNMSAWRNVAYGMRELDRTERRERALELLDRFGVRARHAAKPAALSGGERQRVALARTLAREPRALLLDEPLSALDSATRASARSELASVLAAADYPVLLVTHDPEEAASLADRVVEMDDGSVSES